jgi:Flp pilus assembly protein TadD
VQSEPETRPDQPPNAKTLYSMADILATQGKDAQCEFVLRRCVQEHPRFTPAYNSLAELQMRQGRVHEAVAVLSKALEIRPKDPVLLNNLGMCFLIRKEYGKALDQFTQAGGLVPESEKYRANMAIALGLLGRHEESLALLEQVLPEDKARHNAEILRKARERQANPPADAKS